MHANKTRRAYRLRLAAFRPMRSLAFFLCLLAFACESRAATFSGNARVYSGANSELTWDAGKNALTVSCWFKLAIPSGTNLTEDMTILVNQNGYSPTSPFAYLVRFNIESGNIEFVTRGSTAFTNTLIERPYLERWYHIAVVRSGESFWTYVDGRSLLTGTGPGNVGNAANVDGLTVGGWGNGRYLFGEVQEVAVAQRFRSQVEVKQYMFRDQMELGDLTGYYKLAYATNSADRLRNFVPGGTPATVEGVGPVDFEETSQSGEQSAFDSRRNGGCEALAPLSGAFAWDQIAFARPTPGVAIDFRFGFSSANAFGGFKLGSKDPFDAGPLGPGWRHTFETRLLRSEDFDPSGDSDAIGLMNWSGAVETWDFDWNVGEYRTRHQEYRGELAMVGNTNFHWTTPERLIYIFQHPRRGPYSQVYGRLLEIRDFNSNSVRILWNQTSGLITQVVDSARGVYDLRYNAQQLLTNVAFQTWSVSFTYDSIPRLASKSITNTSGLYTNVNTTWRFEYNATNGLLERIFDPRGNTNVLVQYDKYGRKTNVIDAIGRASRTEFGVPAKRQMRQTDPGGYQWIETYDRKGRILAQQDPLTNLTRYTYDERGNRTSITEPLGWTTFFGYDDRANVVARTNALGEVTRWNFHSFFNKATSEVNPLNWTNRYEIDDATGNLLRHWDDLGTLVSYAYRSNGLVETSTDANGNMTRFAYDTNGFLIARTDAASHTAWFAVNDVGWKTAETNALGQVTRYAHDLNGNVVRIEDTLSRIFTRVYDGNGNLTQQSDAKGRFTFFVFDPANQRTQMLDRASNTWSYSYTSRGKLERTTDPLGFSVTNFYDAANRLARVSDPLGQSVTNHYDENGNQVAFFDKLGRLWLKSYDALNRLVADSNPLGDTKRTTYDAAGRVSTNFTPRGFATIHEYDGRGRLKRLIEPETWEGKPITWRYDYDGVGNITNITDALDGHYVMAYSNRNERIFERNQDGKEWHYAYDALLRLRTQADPNGVVRSLNYDPAGRLTNVVFNTGRVNSLAYDENDNPINLTRNKGLEQTALSLVYDNMDRLTNQTAGTSFQSVGYTRDKLGRVAAILYPSDKLLAQDYDPLGRLTSQIFHFAPQTAFTNSYAYDAADRLVERRYPNGIVQANAFDTAGQITNLSYAPLNPQPSGFNAALGYAYDRNGNKIAGTELGTLAWQPPPSSNERSSFSPAGRITSRVDELSTNSFDYLYDENGNMTNATGGGRAFALAYDEDNRVTSIGYRAGTTNVTIANRYDALGRRVRRIETKLGLDPEITLFALDLSAGMERILAEDRGGTRTYYIHGPDLCYRVNDDGSLTCFHADAMANVIALTDDNANTVAQYAYTPYGCVLGSTNFQSSAFSPQPFLFVGSQGVMEELTGLYFMRARYYSADAGVFLSSDPVKNIGPGWKPTVYRYVNNNPISALDPTGLYTEWFGSVKAGGKAAFGPWGRSAETSVAAADLEGFVAPTYGLGATIGVSGQVVKLLPGALADWPENETDTLTLDGEILSVTIYKSARTEERGFSIDVGLGAGFGAFATRGKDSQHWKASDLISKSSKSEGDRNLQSPPVWSSAMQADQFNARQATVPFKQATAVEPTGSTSAQSGGSSASQAMAVLNVVNSFAPPPGQSWTPAQQAAVVNFIRAFTPTSSPP